MISNFRESSINRRDRLRRENEKFKGQLEEADKEIKKNREDLESIGKLNATLQKKNEVLMKEVI